MRRSAAIALAAALVAGCGLLPRALDASTPCHTMFSEDRCIAMADVVSADAGKDRGDVIGLTILPDLPEKESVGAASPIRVRAEFADGTTHETAMCGGIPWGPACSDAPGLAFRSAIGSYTDVPAGSTPLPSLEPEAIEAASSIVIESLTVRIDRKGEHDIVVGQGSLPNGVWRTGALDFAETWPDHVALRDGVVTLELRSLEPDGKPFDNYYLHGWRPGIERIEAVLLFDVLWFEPGATLEIRNLVVR
jgi:hypothetical protein